MSASYPPVRWSSANAAHALRNLDGRLQRHRLPFAPGTMQEQQQQLSDLKAQADSLQRQNADLTQQVQSLQQQSAELRKQNESLQQQMGALDARLSALEHGGAPLNAEAGALPPGWLLFGGLVVVGLLAVRRRA